MIKTRHPYVLFALIAIAVPLFADSPEYQIGATVASPAPVYRHHVAAATDGTDFFVVWADVRTPGRSAIVGTRVTRSGQMLDPFGIRITSVPAGTSWPAAVWDGTAYLVVWTQGKNFGETLQRDEIWATRVDREGRVLAAPRVISEVGINAQATTTSGAYAASNGTVTVVAYRHVQFKGALRITVLDSVGNVIRHQTLETPSRDLARGISVAATSTRFVVTWATNDSTVFAASVTSDGRAIDAPAQIGEGVDPSAATDGTSVAMVWRRWMPDLSKTVLLGRTADAELAQISDVQTLASDQLIDWPSLVWRGDRYEAIAGQQSQTPTTLNPYGLLSVEFDHDGVERVSSRRGDPLSNAVGPQPVAVTNGSDVLVAHMHPNDFHPQVVARLYRGSSSEPDVQQLLSWSGNAHERPVIASSGSGHFAAWIENTSVYATRIDADGNSLDGRGLELAKAGYAVRAAFDGTNYVVAWIGHAFGGGFIGVRSFSPATGATVAEVHVPAAARWREGLALTVSPDVAYVAWVDEADHRVRATRISLGSRTVGLPLAVSPVGMVAGYPALAWNGSMLLVAWNELRIPSGNLPATPALNVLAARVSGTLSLLDPAPLMIAATAGASLLGPPSVASNGEDWLVVVGRDERDIIARRVLRGGNVEGAAASTIARGVAPSVMWDGARYVLAFKSGDAMFQPEHPLLIGTLPATGALPMMRGTLVSPDVVSPPSLARTPSGDVAIIYTKVSYRPEHLGVERSYYRVMHFVPRGRAVRH